MQRRKDLRQEGY